MDKGYKEVTHIKSTNDKHTKDSETQMIIQQTLRQNPAPIQQKMPIY